MAHLPRSIELRLDLQVQTDPIRGCIEHADGRRHAFWGWLELIEVLQDVAADENQPGTQQPHSRRK